MALQMLHIFKMHGCVCLSVDVQRPRTRHVCSVSELMVARFVHALRVNLPSKANTAAGGLLFFMSVHGTVHVGETFLSWRSIWMNSLEEKPIY